MKDENKKVNYSDLIDLGFKKIEIHDCVHLSQYGYPYFILAYGESDNEISMEWSPVNCEVNLYINAQTYRRNISLEEVKDIIRMLNTKI